jgi:hypothetical protein
MLFKRPFYNQGLGDKHEFIYFTQRRHSCLVRIGGTRKTNGKAGANQHPGFQ